MQTKGYIVFFELHNTSGYLYTNAFLNLFKGFEMWLAKNGRRKWKRKEKWRNTYRGREKGSYDSW